MINIPIISWRGSKYSGVLEAWIGDKQVGYISDCYYKRGTPYNYYVFFFPSKKADWATGDTAKVLMDRCVKEYAEKVYRETSKNWLEKKQEAK